MKKIFPFRHWNKYSQLNRFFIITGFVTILSFLGFLIATPLSSDTKEQNSDNLIKKEDIKDIKQQLLEIKNELNKNLSDSVSESFPGYTVHMAIILKPISTDKKAYIFDMGNNLNKERISLYLNNQNELCYRIIDKSGEIYTITIPYKKDTFKFNSLVYLALEYGEDKNNSFQRILLNGKEIGKYRFSKNLHLAKNIKLEGTTFGADLKGYNCYQYESAYISVAHSTFTNEELIKYYEIIEKFITMKNEKTHKFDCNTYFRIGKNTHFELLKTSK